MKYIFLLAALLSLTQTANANEFIEDSDQPTADSDSTIYNPDGSSGRIRMTENDDGTITSQADYTGPEGKTGYMDTVVSKDKRYSHTTTRTNTNNPDFDGAPMPTEFDENDENVSGISVFNPDGSSMSNTFVKRKDGGMDVRTEVQAADDGNVSETAQKSAKAIKESR